VPCWVFADKLGGNARYIGEAASHEIGHTLGLSHDGLENQAGVTTAEYFEGHGTGDTSWGAIMGAAYDMNLVQWNNGDYADGSLRANNQEDDLAIIASTGNHTPFLPDDVADTNDGAAPLTMSGTTSATATGFIGRTGEADRFFFATGTGTVSFSLVTKAAGLPDLDAALTLLNDQGDVLAQANPTGSIYPLLTASVSAGTYYVRITGVGGGDPLQTGYSNYGSIGSYDLKGTIARQPPPAPTNVNATDTLADRVTVTWTTAAGAVGYDVYRATTNSTAAAARLNTATIAATATTFADMTAVPGTVYFYWVRTKGAVDDSDFSVPDDGLRILTSTRLLAFGDSLAFGSVPVGTTKTAAFTVSNAGNTLLTVSSLTFPSGVFTADIKAFSLAPGAAQRILVTFAPQTAGSFGGAAVFGSNVTAGATSVAISGAATATNKATLTLSGLAQTYTGAPRAVSAITSPAGIATAFTYNGSATPPSNVGSYSVVVTAQPPYVGTKSGTLVIAKGAQAITFPALPAKRVGYPAFTLSASASSGLPVGYTSSNRNVATVSGKTVTIVGKGTAIITAQQAGDGNWNVAPNVTQSLTVDTAAVAPAFTRQPVASNVTAGQTATFTVTASGTPAPTFRWQVSTDGGASFGDLANDSTYGGVTTATLTVKTVASLGGAKYRCIATNEAGSATSAIANLTVIVPGPANDNFENRIVLTGTAASTTGSNVGATREAGEPNHADLAGGKSVWWSWTAPATGTVTISTAGSSFDTLLAVYTGTAVGALTSVGSNDDSSTSTNSSTVVVGVQSGTTYQIAVDGFIGATGTVKLDLTFAAGSAGPVNDNFASSLTLSGLAVTTTGSNVAATKEPGEPNHANDRGGKSVWWSWTAPNTGTVTITTVGSNFDTLLGIYTGDTVSGLTLVATDDDSGGSSTSLVSFNVTAGSTYRIAVDGFSGKAGNIVLALTLTVPKPPPANDNFSGRIALTGSAVSTSGTNVSATRESGEPSHAGQPGGTSVWWSWTASNSGTVTISTAGSNFDTLLGIYTGSSVANLTAVASNDDAGTATTSLVTFSVTTGTTYQIAVDGYQGGTGSVSLGIVFSAGPTNDHFADRIPLTGSTVTTSGTNVGATKDPFEPAHAGNAGGRSVWWSWIAPSSGTVTISTTGSNFDTVLGVYTGNAVNGLTTIKSNDDKNRLVITSEVSFAAVAGTTYQIAVDGFGGASGSIVLTINRSAAGGLPADAEISGAAASKLSVVTSSGGRTGSSAALTSVASSSGVRTGSSGVMTSDLLTKNLAEFTVSDADTVAWVSSLGFGAAPPPAAVPPLLAAVMNVDSSSPAAQLPMTSLVSTDNGVRLTLQFRQNRALAALGIGLAVQTSADGVTWSDLPASAIAVLADDDADTARYEASVPVSLDSKVQLRLAIVVDPAWIGLLDAPADATGP
ncbi:MAG: MBG domain-containing protein, partial [Verrucomicrobiota bacterium]